MLPLLQKINSRLSGLKSIISFLVVVITICFFTSSLMLLNESSSLSHLILLIFFSVLLTVSIIIAVLFLSHFILARWSSEQKFISHLRAFSAFVHDLNTTSGLQDAYIVLNNFIDKMVRCSYSAVLHKVDISENVTDWQAIPTQDEPLCQITDACPLLYNSQEFRVNSIKNESICQLQNRQIKKGCYICLPVDNSSNPECILQLYCEKENVFDNATITRLKSYIEIARPVINSKHIFNMLNKKASTDKLTQLYNRNFLEPYLENLIEEVNESDNQFSIIIIDLDRFKEINDTFGHSAGDKVLSIFAETALKCIRKSDLIARYGGDEFITVLPSTDTETAYAIAERIRLSVKEITFPSIDELIIPSISCSLGISTYPIHCDTKESLIKTCDAALYKAKQAGRNCTRIYNADMVLNENSPSSFL